MWVTELPVPTQYTPWPIGTDPVFVASRVQGADGDSVLISDPFRSFVSPNIGSNPFLGSVSSAFGLFAPPRLCPGTPESLDTWVHRGILAGKYWVRACVNLVFSVTGHNGQTCSVRYLQSYGDLSQRVHVSNSISWVSSLPRANACACLIGSREKNTRDVMAIITSTEPGCAAHLIWVLRCERRIAGSDNPGGYHSREAVKNRWHGKTNDRMQIDCLLTNKYLYENKAQKTKTVYATNTEDFHRDWCRNPGVLVGKTSRHPSGRNR